jgi:mono/diheme cytochrome c family protein
MSARHILLSVALAIMCVGASRIDARAQAVDRSHMSGEALYEAACVACHGRDGKGQPKSIVGFDTPLPDFTDCSFTTPEADLDWSAVVHLGGRARAMDSRMPSFVDALSDPEIARVIDHMRGFCREPGWPRGELNFPRAFFTEKAYPENEAVLTTTMSRHPAGAIEHEFLYEHRIGRRAQYEINVPVAMQHGESGWHRGLGDVNAAFKYSFVDSLERGAIVSAGGEVTLPTGRETEGFGGGTTIFEAFAMSGHALPNDSFIQFQAGFEIPAHPDVASKELFWRTAIGKTFFNNRWGRQWSPMAEFLLARPIGVGERAEWDVVPQVQVSLSGLQHVLLNVGVRIPVNARDSRSNAAMVYLLWDWFDGGLFSNWRSR